jgi:A/G-specific adenine glycosylase
MLQQTQAPRVVPKYHDFLVRFPDAASCAAASAGDVIHAWNGLGYNRRAVHLHRAAVAIVERHDGRVPADLGALLALPGVGPYTARAVLVFAFERDIGLVDTNAGRFVARALVGQSVSSRDAQAAADHAVPAGHAWAWGQAVFDLGASICTKRAPRCGVCPIARMCVWNRAGRPAPDPIEGSASISKPQSVFAGSFREGRGRLVAALREGPIAACDLGAAAGWPDDPDRVAEAVASLVRDGLATLDDAGTVAPP